MCWGNGEEAIVLFRSHAAFVWPGILLEQPNENQDYVSIIINQNQNSGLGSKSPVLDIK